MGLIKELINDARFILNYRRRMVPIQKTLDKAAPKEMDLAPDFTLYDTTGTNPVTLSNFHGVKPVALVFGSFT